MAFAMLLAAGTSAAETYIANNPLAVKHSGRGRATVDANGFQRVFEVFAGASTTL